LRKSKQELVRILVSSLNDFKSNQELAKCKNYFASGLDIDVSNLENTRQALHAHCEMTCKYKDMLDKLTGNIAV